MARTGAGPPAERDGTNGPQRRGSAASARLSGARDPRRGRRIPAGGGHRDAAAAARRRRGGGDRGEPAYRQRRRDRRARGNGPARLAETAAGVAETTRPPGRRAAVAYGTGRRAATRSAGRGWRARDDRRDRAGPRNHALSIFRPFWRRIRTPGRAVPTGELGPPL